VKDGQGNHFGKIVELELMLIRGAGITVCLACFKAIFTANNSE